MVVTEAATPFLCNAHWPVSNIQGSRERWHCYRVPSQHASILGSILGYSPENDPQAITLNLLFSIYFSRSCDSPPRDMKQQHTASRGGIGAIGMQISTCRPKKWGTCGYPKFSGSSPTKRQRRLPVSMKHYREYLQSSSPFINYVINNFQWIFYFVRRYDITWDELCTCMDQSVMCISFVISFVK